MHFPAYLNHRTTQHPQCKQPLHSTGTQPWIPRPFTHNSTTNLHAPSRHCKTIQNPKHNKGTGINSNSIHLLILLVKCSIPTVKNDLCFLFNVIYQNKLPQQINGYFTNVYLFCLHKDINTSPNSNPWASPLQYDTLLRATLQAPSNKICGTPTPI